MARKSYSNNTVVPEGTAPLRKQEGRISAFARAFVQSIPQMKFWWSQ